MAVWWTVDLAPACTVHFRVLAIAPEAEAAPEPTPAAGDTPTHVDIEVTVPTHESGDTWLAFAIGATMHRSEAIVAVTGSGQPAAQWAADEGRCGSANIQQQSW